MLHNNTDMIRGMNTKTAQAVGVTAKFIGDIFAGRRRPSSSLAVRLESVTGIPAADWIFAEPCELRERLAAIYAKNGLVEGGCNAEMIKQPSDIEKAIQVLDSSIRRLQEERRRLIALLPDLKERGKRRDDRSMKEMFGGLI